MNSIIDSMKMMISKTFAPKTMLYFFNNIICLADFDFPCEIKTNGSQTIVIVIAPYADNVRIMYPEQTCDPAIKKPVYAVEWLRVAYGIQSDNWTTIKAQ